MKDKLAFLAALYSGDVNVVNEHIANQTVDVNAHINAEKPLAIAVRLGHSAIVDALLSAGAEVNDVGHDSQTAMHICANTQNVDVFKVLLAHGGDLTVRDVNDHTPLDVATRVCNERMTLALINAGASLDNCFDALVRAAAISVTVASLLLVERHIDLKTIRDSDQHTPCHFVAEHDEDPAAVLAFLVDEAGVDMNARDIRGRTPCHTAAFRGKKLALRRLIEHGADFDEPDDNGHTPLHLSCYGLGDCTTLLLSMGAQIDSLTYISHMQPVHFAASCNRSPLPLAAVVAMGADLDAPDAGGNIPREAARIFGVALPTDQHALVLLRRQMLAGRLAFVRERAIQVCFGLRPLELDALQMCEVLVHACGPVGLSVPFHVWWKIATTVKHFGQE